MGGFSNFAISFSIISILTGGVILYDYGLAWAGTAASLIGWPLITFFVLCIAASMAEVASAYPTAGGLYYWASRMKNKNWGWWTAWLNLVGQFAIVAGINYAAALFLNATIITPLTGGAYSNTTVFFGDPAFGAEGPALSGALVTMKVCPRAGDSIGEFSKARAMTSASTPARASTKPLSPAASACRISTLSGSGPRADSPRRERTTTRWPREKSSAAIPPPTNPLPPATATVSGFSPRLGRAKID